MSSPAAISTSQTSDLSLAFLDRVLRPLRPRDFAVRAWDGTMWPPEAGQQARFTIVLRHPGAVRAMFWPPNEVTLGEAYIYDDIDIEGDVEAAAAAGDRLLSAGWSTAERVRLGLDLLRLPASATGHRRRDGRGPAHLRGVRHSRGRDQRAVRYHYDVPGDFYALWLDERMVYSCAYFATAKEDLNTAQARKLDYVCRKLRLRPGERLLDIGCGWGGLVIHAAQTYGVLALGITLSPPQAEVANARIRAAGLADRCRVEVRDYREVDAAGGFDKLASIGMFEHVGAARLPAYFAQAWRLLRPGGAFLNHGIATQGITPPRHGPSFVERYVFPDGELLPIHTTLTAAERCGFEVRDVESLREHYTLTLRHWVRRLEAHHDAARRAAGEVIYRIWRLYMAGSAHGFSSGRLNLYQTLLVKPDAGESGLPLTRADWYA